MNKNFSLSSILASKPSFQYPQKFLKIFLFQFFALIFVFFSAEVYADITLSTPERTARGDAFLVTASCPEAVEDFVFFWRGRTYPVKARQEVVDGKMEYAAQILLPVPLDEKAAKLRLGAGVGKKATETVHMDISLFDRKRPVQKLTVDKKYVNPPAREQERIKRDREKVRQALGQQLPERMWSLPFTRPVPGGVSSLFGMKRVFNGEPRSVHRGLDLRGAAGTPIYACADGQVALVDNLYFSGNTVYLNHGDGVFTAYLHMSEPKVSPGQMVKKGDLVGLVGSTGRVTGPHLHLSLLVQGQSVDPEPLLGTWQAPNK